MSQIPIDGKIVQVTRYRFVTDLYLIIMSLYDNDVLFIDKLVTSHLRGSYLGYDMGNPVA